MRALALALVIASIAGCTADYPEGRIACITNTDCPAGWTCSSSSSRCFSSMQGIDAANGLDGSHADAGRDAGADGALSHDVGTDAIDAPATDAVVGLDTGVQPDAPPNDGWSPPPDDAWTPDAYLPPRDTGPAPCVTSTDCNDGIYCNGVEICDLASNTCGPGTTPCTGGSCCNESIHMCTAPMDGASCV